jgi:hypothetical protein
MNLKSRGRQQQALRKAGRSCHGLFGSLPRSLSFNRIKRGQSDVAAYELLASTFEFSSKPTTGQRSYKMAVEDLENWVNQLKVLLHEFP